MSCEIMRSLRVFGGTLMEVLKTLCDRKSQVINHWINVDLYIMEYEMACLWDTLWQFVQFAMEN